MRFELFGRKTSDSPFVSIEIDNFPWKDNRPTRNYVPGLTINSSYASGDTSFSYTDIKLANVEPYLDYKLVFLETRGPKQKNLQFGEIEFPGVLMPEWFGPNDRLLL